MPTSTPIRWGIIGPGNIAKKLAAGLAETETGTLVAAASRDLARAQAFLKEHGGDKAFDSYQAMLDDPEVDAVYIATPHPMHAEWAIKAARAGKHILCEKPATLNTGEAMAVLDAVEQAGVFFMEAFMYRCHPQTARIVELIKDGAVGEIRQLRGTFGFDQGPKPEGRHQANALGGGGILDLGCYPISMMRLLAGVANGKPFLDPSTLKAVGHLDAETGVDTWTSALLKFEGDILGEASCAVRLKLGSAFEIFGSEGKLTITAPWFCKGDLILERPGKDTVTETIDTGRNLYSYQCEVVAKYAADGQAPSPAMSWADTLGNSRTLDQWREEIGLSYAMEKQGKIKVAHGGTLPPRGKQIETGSLPGIDKPVSRLIMGTAGRQSLAAMAPLWDTYFEYGGNTFDEGTVYRQRKRTQIAIGQWVASRGIREEVVMTEKGGHSPYCYPQLLEAELEDALFSQQTDYFDLYMLHRDNPEVPVSEFIDVINRMHAAGKLRAYGLSNWTVERAQEAVDYAEKAGLVKPICISNQFSLARLVNPIWAGCYASSTPEYRQWLTEHQVALLPWSSQAKGMFSERSGPDKKDDPWLVDGFYSDDNFERKKRCYELAEKKGVTPITLALAYVLRQPFPTFPIIGPRNAAELRDSVAAFAISLSAEDMAWLNLE